MCRVQEQEAGGFNTGLAANALNTQHLQKASAQLASADKDSSHAVLDLSQQPEADNSIIEMQDELILAQQQVVELSEEVVELRQKVSCMCLLNVWHRLCIQSKQALQDSC